MATLKGVTWGMNGVAEGNANGTVSDITNTSYTCKHTSSSASCSRSIRFYPSVLLPSDAILTKITANFTFRASTSSSHYAAIWAEGNKDFSNILVSKSGLGTTATEVSLSIDASRLKQFSDGALGLSLGGYKGATSTFYWYFTDVSFDLEYTAPSITVTTNVSPAEGGTVTGGGIYESGTLITAMAYPNKGYAFSNWLINGGDAGSDNPISGVLTADTTVTAIFVKTEAPGNVYCGVKRVSVYCGNKKVSAYCGTKKLI